MNKFIIREVFCNLREISGIKKRLTVEFSMQQSPDWWVAIVGHHANPIITNTLCCVLANKGWCDRYARVLFSIYFKLIRLFSSLLSARAKQKRQAAAPPFLPVPAPLVVHPIVVQLSSEWSTRTARIRDDSSTPARFPERPSVTSLRWEWKATWRCVAWKIIF